MSEAHFDASAEDQTLIKVKYQCTHLTCRLECYHGQLELAKGRFERLKEGATQFSETGATMFKSPSMVCKIATTQDFRVVEFTNENPIVNEETTNTIQHLEEKRTRLKRSMDHEKQEYERKRDELKTEVDEITLKLKNLRAKERSRRMKKDA